MQVKCISFNLLPYEVSVQLVFDLLLTSCLMR